MARHMSTWAATDIPTHRDLTHLDRDTQMDTQYIPYTDIWKDTDMHKHANG